MTILPYRLDSTLVALVVDRDHNIMTWNPAIRSATRLADLDRCPFSSLPFSTEAAREAAVAILDKALSEDGCGKSASNSNANTNVGSNTGTASE